MSAALTLLASVKARLKIDPADTNDDALLTSFIEYASGLFCKYCHRTFERGVNVQEEFWCEDRELRPSRYPIEAVASFETMSDQATGWVLESDVQYQLWTTKNGIYLVSRLGSGMEKLRLTYTGGYVLPGNTPGAGQTALPNEIEHACTEQVAYWFSSKDRLGVSSASTEGSSVSYSNLKLVASVQMTLDRYRRFLM
ncbi:MAG: head-tail connector protein [Verrucomicrobiota bacterium]|nr:head-tail connector protein [Verrucomicrobiota bacterium]